MKIIILAGGQGTRLWPISTQEKPKQFHRLGTKETLLRETFLRVKSFGVENIFVITLEEQKHLVAEQIPEIPSSHIFAAPLPQDSAMGVAFAVKMLEKQGIDPQETLVFLPADHLIEPADAFVSFLKTVETEHQKYRDSLMTIGITPTGPMTRFGYIELRTQSSELRERNKVFKVEKFLEKPNEEKAKELIAEGNVVWNSGFIVGTLARLLQSFQTHAPEFLSATESIEAFKNAPRISFDYAIWEKESNILCMPSQNLFFWNDVGTWDSIPNLHHGQKIVEIQSHSNIAHSETGKPIVFLGAENLVVIESENGLIVAHKDHLGGIKDALKQL